MATISSVGAWTVLDFDPIGDPATVDGLPGQTSPLKGFHVKAGVNVRRADDMNFERLKNNNLPELDQFVQLMADGYNINTQSAWALFYHLVSMAMNRQNPVVSQATLYAP
jgi:hypothetical protein